MKKTYPSKVSYWLLIFVFLVFYLPVLPNLFIGKLNEKLLSLIAFETVVFSFIVHLFLNTYYTINNTTIKIKCGVLKSQQIDISTIKEISKTKSIISSPAPSFDRILIRHGKFDELIISPKDKLSLVKNLMEINPNIKNNLK
tara:strand:- start:261 stop:686 length:426 start_codon:yes stop_codon:yes gene_type:complete